MGNDFAVGDHVRWSSEAGEVTGVITRMHTRAVEDQGHLRHGSPDDPQYEIASDRTDHLAMHRGQRAAPDRPTGPMTPVHEIWTIGHWTCPIPTFLAPLDAAHVDLLTDVRAHPGSRRNPQFGSAEMAQWLPEHGIEYRHLPALAGRRRRQSAVDPDLNAGWQNAGFRNYADYTHTEEFERGLAELTELASHRRVAIMCGEPMPWRCHRLLIANTLTARGWTVRHLVAGGPTRTHVLGEWGATPRVDGEHVTYPNRPSPDSPPPC